MIQYQTVNGGLEEPKCFIQVLAGLRQVRKSTLIGQVMDDLSIPFSSYSADDVLGVSSLELVMCGNALVQRWFIRVEKMKWIL